MSEKKKSPIKIYIILSLLIIPTFFRMLRPGIFSMQDFHVFRQLQFDKCVKDFQIPCRWSPDAGFGYGEPIFNFYGQLVYVFGEVFVLFNSGYINAIKILFILSLVLSAFGMYFLAKQVWTNTYSSIASAILYVYAPYRALDVYVRGALPEAFAFVFFPIITLFFLDLQKSPSKKNVLKLTLSLTGLLLTHNLSFLMYMLFFIPWVAISLFQKKDKKIIIALVKIIALTAMLSAFYLLPVIFERNLVRLDMTTTGYFDFRAHFATLTQLLFERNWGYGASLWGPKDDLSLSVGHLQWILPFFLIPFLLRSNKKVISLTLIGVGWLSLFLTHNKSTFIWEALPFMKYIQFPWRFLSIATFCFSLAGGSLIFFLKKEKLQILTLIFIFGLSMILTLSFFKEDIWLSITDKILFSGARWDEQRAASLGDYWPSEAKSLPNSPAPEIPMFIYGEGEIRAFKETSNTIEAEIKVHTPESVVALPAVYFPGWSGGNILPATDLKLISLPLSAGTYEIKLKFGNTPVRTAGNLITLIGIFYLFFPDKFQKLWKRK